MRKEIELLKDHPDVGSELIDISIDIGDVFDGLFDIEDADFHPKPNIESYKRFLEQHNVAPDRAIMFEDMAKNLTPASQLGMITVWLPTGSEWSSAGADHDHIDHVADSLDEFLAAFLSSRESAAV